MAESISVRLRSSARRASCSYCHEELFDPIRLCMACHTSVHEDCYGELGRCPTLGCVASGVWRAEDQQPTPTINTPPHAPVEDLSPPAPAESRPQLTIFARLLIFMKLLIALPLTLIAWLWTTLWIFVSLIGIVASLGTFHEPQDLLFLVMVLVLNLLFFTLSRQLTRWTQSLMSSLNR